VDWTLLRGTEKFPSLRDAHISGQRQLYTQTRSLLDLGDFTSPAIYAPDSEHTFFISATPLTDSAGC
jgi:hypothetical protein